MQIGGLHVCHHLANTTHSQTCGLTWGCKWFVEPLSAPQDCCAHRLEGRAGARVLRLQVPPIVAIQVIVRGARPEAIQLCILL